MDDLDRKRSNLLEVLAFLLALREEFTGAAQRLKNVRRALEPFMDDLDVAVADLLAVVEALTAAITQDDANGGLTTRITLRIADEARVHADRVRRLLRDKARHGAA